jgi:hypothetical protein
VPLGKSRHECCKQKFLRSLKRCTRELRTGGVRGKPRFSALLCNANVHVPVFLSGLLTSEAAGREGILDCVPAIKRHPGAVKADSRHQTFAPAAGRLFFHFELIPLPLRSYGVAGSQQQQVNSTSLHSSFVLCGLRFLSSCVLFS